MQQSGCGRDRPYPVTDRGRIAEARDERHRARWANDKLKLVKVYGHRLRHPQQLTKGSKHSAAGVYVESSPAESTTGRKRENALFLICECCKFQ